MVKELHVRLDVLNGLNAVSKRSNDEQETLMLLRELTDYDVEEAPDTIWSDLKAVNKCVSIDVQADNVKVLLLLKRLLVMLLEPKKAKVTLAKTQRKKGSVLSWKTKKTKRSNPASKRLKRINKPKQGEI